MKPVQTWEVQTKGQVKFNKLHSSILRLPIGQYVEQRTDITFTFISSQFLVHGTYAAPLPSSPISFFWFLWTYAAPLPSSSCLFNLTYSITWAYARLQPSSCVNLATSCNLVHVLTSYNVSFLFVFGTYAAPLPSSSPWTYAAPLPSSPSLSFIFYEPMQRLCHPVHFFSFVSQNHLNSTQIANLKFQVPSLAFHSEPYANAKLNYRSTLSGYSAKFCYCNSCWTPCQHSGRTRWKPTRPKVHKGTLQGQITPQLISSAKFITTRENATPNVGKWRWQSSSQKPSSSLHSNHGHSCIQIHHERYNTV